MADTIKRVKKKKDSGLDGLSGEMVRQAYRVIPDYFFVLFKSCFDTGQLPAAWKKAEVIVILKSENKLSSDPKSYRSICLLPVLSKVVKRLMTARLDKDRSEVRISRSQFGFVRSRSTVYAWLQLHRVPGKICAGGFYKLYRSVRQYKMGHYHRYPEGIWC